jgi:hypothetical protein
LPDHATSELSIFRSFAEVCPLGIDLTSVQKTEPPEPDIRCRLVSGGACAFELVEVVDPSLAKISSLQSRLQTQLETEVCRRPELVSLYRNASINVGFHPELSVRKREQAVRRIITYLERLPMAFAGNVPLQEALSKDLSRFHISRGDSDGPLFHVDAVISFADPSRATIRDKLCRPYNTKLPLELIAYFARQPMNAGTPWALGLERAVRADLEGSQFLRVWFFELSSGAIVVVEQNRHLRGSEKVPATTGPHR